MLVSDMMLTERWLRQTDWAKQHSVAKNKWAFARSFEFESNTKDYY